MSLDYGTQIEFIGGTCAVCGGVQTAQVECPLVLPDSLKKCQILHPRNFN